MSDSLLVGSVDYGSHDGCHFQVEVISPDGRRFRYQDSRLSEGSARRLVLRVREHGYFHPEFWHEHYPVYGSPAFEGQERQAHFWSQHVRGGHCSLDDVPSSLRSLL